MYRASLLKELFEGRTILIAGYGREGRSTHTLLQQLLPSCKPHIAQNDSEMTEALQRQRYDMIIKSPGIPMFRLDGLCDLNTVTSQTDLFLQVYGDLTIGVTGTKGKSTTTNLIYSVLHSVDSGVVMAGNMGIPLFDIIPTLNAKSVVVAEFSCHQLEGIRRAPHIGVLLNLYQEHLDHYRGYLDYKMAKFNIGLRQSDDDTFYYCSDNEELAALVASHRDALQGKVVPYSLADATPQLRSYPTPLQGDHNLSNTVVAHLVAQQRHVGEEAFASALASFKGLEHRLEKVGTYSGITFYNDSISTIPAATEAAVDALGNVDTLILGGFDRGIDYSGLAQYLSTSAVRNMVFVGKAGERIREAMPTMPENYLVEDDYAKIVAWCFEHTAKGKVCLLSPAAASYDAFKNFEERGSRYKQLVMNHPQEPFREVL